MMTPERQVQRALAVLAEHLGEIALVYRDKTTKGRPYSRVRGADGEDERAMGLVKAYDIETQSDAERYDVENA
ncbi:MAG TPA: hypothetical protein ENH78_01615 [Phycisphaerae bacterium]|nr:hypothetical protein [Phycisphaerae bacterium]